MAQNETYEEFVEKFKPKKTTDDCYTPEAVYTALLDFVRRRYGLGDDVPIVRPFYPGGDYEAEEYPEGCVVVDNPPFSIFTKICKTLAARGVRFFLFGPHLTLFSGGSAVEGVSYHVTNAAITYENGANVNTSFVSYGLEAEPVVRTEPELRKALVAADKGREKKSLGRIEYPRNVMTSAILGNYVRRGVTLEYPRRRLKKISRLSSMGSRSIFGGAFLSADPLPPLPPLPPPEQVAEYELSEGEKREVERLSGM